MKKLVLVLAPIAAVVAIAMASASPAAGDCIFPPGAPHTKDYCIKFCKVPFVIGDRLPDAIKELHEHNCGFKQIKLGGEGHHKIVVNQSPGAGANEPNRFKVKLYVLKV